MASLGSMFEPWQRRRVRGDFCRSLSPTTGDGSGEIKPAKG
jgi:hypothetical protein